MGQAIIGFLLGGGFLTFIQFLISRSDAKNDQFEAIVKSIADLHSEISDLRNELKNLDEKGDMRGAIDARVRILRFSDELIEGRKHSKDSFDQCMSDIDTYESYTNTHPDFKNNQTINTVKHINAVYQERLSAHDFL